MIYQIKAYGADGNEILDEKSGQGKFDTENAPYITKLRDTGLLLEENKRDREQVAYWIVSDMFGGRVQVVENEYGSGDSFVSALQHALARKLKEGATAYIGINQDEKHVVLFNDNQNKIASFTKSKIEAVGFLIKRPTIDGLTKEYTEWHALNTDSLYSARFVREIAKELPLSFGEETVSRVEKEQIGFFMEDLPDELKDYANALHRVLQAQRANEDRVDLINILNSTLSEHESVPANLIKNLGILACNTNYTPSDYQRMAASLDARVVLAIQAVEAGFSGKVSQILTGEITGEKYAEIKNATSTLTRAHIEEMGM